jgi:hypothetical protein
MRLGLPACFHRPQHPLWHAAVLREGSPVLKKMCMLMNTIVTPMQKLRVSWCPKNPADINPAGAAARQDS